MEKTEEGRPITLTALIGLSMASVTLNVAGAYLLFPAPWNFLLAVAVFFVELTAFLALVHVAKDFNQPGALAKGKALASFVVFLAMCAIGIYSGHRSLTEVNHLMSAPAQTLEISSSADLATATALDQQATSWRASAEDLRERGYVTRAADLEGRALEAQTRAITLRGSSQQASATAAATPTLGETQIWLILIVIEIAKDFGRFLFAFPASWLTGERRRKAEVQEEAPAIEPVEEVVMAQEAVEAPVVTTRRRRTADKPVAVTGYVPKKRLLDRRVDPTLILNALIEAGAKPAAIYQARALLEASGGQKIAGIYQPDVAYAM